MSRTKLALLAASATLLIAACGSSHKTTTNTTLTPTAPTSAATNPPSSAASPTTVASSPTTAAPGPDLAGTWNGQYSGAYTGTFHLSWVQTGTNLNGNITLSSLGGTLAINGTVQGGSIKFGTVGSEDITYAGSVSGNSMSGSYQVVAPSGSTGGSWSASKA